MEPTPPPDRGRSALRDYGFSPQCESSQGVLPGPQRPRTSSGSACRPASAPSCRRVIKSPSSPPGHVSPCHRTAPLPAPRPHAVLSFRPEGKKSGKRKWLQLLEIMRRVMDGRGSWLLILDPRWFAINRRNTQRRYWAILSDNT